jgi:hypothetical protein
MRTALAIIIGIHGIIHLFGFLKAFGFVEFNAISLPISKTLGIFWLLAFVLFAFATVLLVLSYNNWWAFGFLALIISQVLILNYWQDAKFGSIANLIILLSVIVAYSNFSFQKKIAEEQIEMFQNARPPSNQVITKQTLSALPHVIQKWLTNSGILGRSPIANVRLLQELELKLNPDQENWNDGKAEQYFTVNPPAFHWNIKTEMNSILSVVGRDKFQNGKGEMTIKLLSLIPVAQTTENTKVDQATLQRFLAEIVWFPTASLSPYITWEEIDENTAKATMKYRGTEGEGVFTFDNSGNFLNFSAYRFKDANDKAPIKWIVSTLKTEERNGIKLPVELKAEWELENGKWTWLLLKIKEIEYNLSEMPVFDILPPQ